MQYICLGILLFPFSEGAVLNIEMYDSLFKLFSLASGNIVAICMSHPDASEDVLRSWISHLQSENPELANISVIFNLSPTPR